MEDLRWHVVNVPENDTPNFRLVSSKTGEAEPTHLSLIRTNDRDEKSPGIKATDINMGSLKNFVLVGSAAGAICIYVPPENTFRLWNPVENSSRVIKKTPLNPVAYAFYASLISNKLRLVILVVTRNPDRSASVWKFSTLSMEWKSLPYIKSSVRCSGITGVGCRVGTLIYWPNYSETLEFDSVSIFDTADSNFHVDTIRSPAYDFICTFVKRVEINSSKFMITKRTTKRGIVVTDLLSSPSSSQWILLCSAPANSTLIDVLTPSLFLLVRAGNIEIVDQSMTALSKYSFLPNLSLDCLSFRPNLDISCLKGKKPFIDNFKPKKLPWTNKDYDEADDFGTPAKKEDKAGNPNKADEEVGSSSSGGRALSRSMSLLGASFRRD